MAIASSLSSVNARLFAFAKQLKSRGHQVLIAGPDELDQVRLEVVALPCMSRTAGSRASADASSKL